MTAGLVHIFLVSLGLILGAVLCPARRLMAWPIVGWTLLPLAYGDYVAISDYLFEALSANLYYACAGLALVILTIFSVMAWKARYKLTFASFMCLIVFVLANIANAHYESGFTPEVFDKPQLVVAWLCAVFAMILVVVEAHQQRSAWLTRWVLPVLIFSIFFDTLL